MTSYYTQDYMCNNTSDSYRADICRAVSSLKMLIQLTPCCFLFSVNIDWKCKAVLWKAWNRHLIWIKLIGRAVARTVLAKPPQKVLPGLGKAKHRLYHYLHNNVFFYSGFLSPMMFARVRAPFHLEVTGSDACQGTSLRLQPKIHCMSSPTDSQGLQGINSLWRVQATVMSTH